MSANVLAYIIMLLAGWHKPAQALTASEIAPYIIRYSQSYSLDPALVTAVIFVESSFNEKAVSKAGALGLGQILPSSSSGDDYRILGRKAFFDPNLNIYLTARHMAKIRGIMQSDNPNCWLSLYAGYRPHAGRCYKTNYSIKVMRAYRRIKHMEKHYD